MECAKQQRAFRGSGFSLPPDDAEPDADYRAVLDWVWSFSARPRSPADRSVQRATKMERMRALLEALGHPEQVLPAVMVAGTKGKGSTVAMLAACLRAAGLRTGRYTSPHLVNWRERTVIDDQPITPTEVVAVAGPVRRAVEGLDPAVGSPTTFEVGTAISFAYFARAALDVAVVEVGTGGRFDATNVLEPLVSVITPISYDHTATLGETLTEIAWHKSGILRAARPAISAPQVDEARLEIERQAALVAAQLEEVGREWTWTATAHGLRIVGPQAQPLDTRLALIGAHQRDNAATAVAALHALGRVEPRLATSPPAIQAGLASVDWPGRLQVVAEHPLLVVDGAHNAASAAVVRASIEHDFRFTRLHLVLGLSEGKDAAGVLDALAPRSSAIYLTRSHHERSADPTQLALAARAAAPEAEISIAAEVATALEAALGRAGSDDLILVTGSLFVVGETLVWWRRSHR